MADHLLDTGILIRHLRKRPGYHELMARLAEQGRLSIASFTRLEVIRGMREHEREATFALLDALHTHPLDVETADLAGEMIRFWQSQGKTLSGPDAVIAASAICCGASLVTTNPKHFLLPDLDVLAAGENGELSPRT
ncbi:MAG TPA: PIN domain-containing protein [Anaerolineae bacterium]|nr:PIN domain-containing protein [Anaerolineae bacterium]